MAASSQTGQTNVGKKVWILGIGIVLVIAAYTAGWFFLAERAKSSFLTFLERSQANDVSAECPDVEIRGYPFRFGLFCSGISIDDHRNGISASFGALRSAAQVYAPNHIVWELDQPAVIRAAPGMTYSAEWANLQSSANLGLGGIERTSLVIEGLKTTLVSALAGEILNLTASHSELHLRQNGDDLDAALSLQAINGTIQGQPQPLPPVSLSADLAISGGAAALRTEGAVFDLRGSSGVLRSLGADLGESRTITITGPFSFSADGYLSGQLKLEISGIKEWAETLKKAFPEAEKNIKTAGNMLTALVAGGTKVSVDLTVNNGEVFISGFIPVGEIPPI